jgi:3-phenylpropionate/trans-cinnamate dioxygenase ferredoxin reductase subunit
MPEAGAHVIVGAGLAGAKAAEGLRSGGFEGRIVLIGNEPEAPYERPPLSKDYLRGESSRADALVHPDGFYAEHSIELRTGEEVSSLDVDAAAVVLASGERIGYARLLLATGAEPRRLAVPGAELGGVHTLRDLADADRLAAGLKAASRVVVVGAGWIGSEVAASARQMGLEVSVIERGEVPLERVLGAEVGSIYAEIHRDHGVELLGGATIEALEGSAGVEGVRLADGRLVEGDLVVAGIGVQPRTELAEAAGIEVSNGIVVDASLRTSADGVFAAGDVANARHDFYGAHLRVEHWANAARHGEAAARGMLGKPPAEAQVPYFFSDQYDVGMEYTGYATDWDEVVLRGDPATREFIAFWLSDGRVVAGMNVNVWEVADEIGALIRSQRRVDPDRLRDPDAPLADLRADTDAGPR